MKIIRILTILFVMSCIQVTLQAEGTTLAEINKPGVLQVGEKGIYILCDSTVYHYSYPDGRFIGTFGTEGEGPGELKKTPFYTNCMAILEDRIYLDSVDKILYFTWQGKLLEERKKRGVLVTRMLPIEDRYVAKSLDRSGGKKEYMVITLLDSQMNKIKELHRQISPVQLRSTVMIPDAVYYTIANNKILIDKSNQGFQIDVYDKSGSLLYQIKKEMKPVPVPQKFKEKILQMYKADPIVKRIGYENLRKRNTYIYPDHFPAIQAIKGESRFLYVKTFEKKENREKYLIMDEQGKILKSLFLPVTEIAPLLARLNGLDQQLFDIYKDTFYYITFNETIEQWQLYQQKM